MTSNLEKKFIDAYSSYFNSNQTHLLFDLLRDPSITLAISKGRLPTKKTVLNLMTSKGIDTKGAEEDCEEEPKSTIGNTKVKPTTLTTNQNIVTLLLRIESRIKDLEATLNKNIDFAMPSSDVQTDLLLSPEQRRTFMIKREKYNKLMARYTSFYKEFIKTKSNQDEYEFTKDLFRQTLYMIDLIINDSYISKYQSSSHSHKLNPNINIVVFDRDDSYGENGDFLTQEGTIRKVLEAQKRSQLYKLKKDSIIFLSYVMNYTEADGPKQVISIAFYVDYKLLIQQFHPTDSEIDTYKDTLQISPQETDVWDNSKFDSYFLAEVQDAYVHFMCALLYMDPFINHGGMYQDVYDRYFG